MATHELYLGGPRFGAGRNAFPAAPFDNSLGVFKNLVAAEHKKTLLAALTRTLAFGGFTPGSVASANANDPALNEYFRSNDVAVGDILNIQVIPANTLLFGMYANNENPETGVRLSFGLDDGTTFGGAAEIAAPVQAAGSTVDTGGSVADGTTYYVITAITAAGETPASNEISIVSAGGDTSVNTLNWAAVVDATGYRAYRGAVSGTYDTYITFGAVATGDDTGAAGTAGTPPTVNTSGDTVDCGAAFNKFSVPNGAAWISAGAASLATANFSNVPRVLQATVRALGDNDFGALRFSVSPLVLQLQEGQT